MLISTTGPLFAPSQGTYQKEEPTNASDNTDTTQSSGSGNSGSETTASETPSSQGNSNVGAPQNSQSSTYTPPSKTDQDVNSVQTSSSAQASPTQNVSDAEQSDHALKAAKHLREQALLNSMFETNLGSSSLLSLFDSGAAKSTSSMSGDLIAKAYQRF